MAEITYLSKIDATRLSKNWSTTGVEEITDYTVSWADLVAAGFGEGDDVFFVVRLSVGGFDKSEHMKDRMYHGTSFAGATLFDGSESKIEPNVAAGHLLAHYGWITRHTLILDENIYVQRGNDYGTHIQYEDDFSLLVLRLNDLTENTDFLYDVEAHSGNAPADYDTSGAAVTVPSGGDDWLIIANTSWFVDDASTFMISALNVGGVHVSEMQWAGEDAYEERTHLFIHYMEAVSSPTEVQVLYRAPSETHDCTRTAVFALRLNRFRDHAGVRSTNAVTHSVVNTFQEVTGLPAYVHGGTGANPLFIFASTKYQTPGDAYKGPAARIQVGGSDWPVSGFAESGGAFTHDANDKIPLVLFGAKAESAATLDIDFDVLERNDISPNYSHVEHILVAFSAALGAGGGAAGASGLANENRRRMRNLLTR